MASKKRKFEIHKLTISGLVDGTDYGDLIVATRRKIRDLGDAVWESGGKSHALAIPRPTTEGLRLRFLSYKTGYRPDVLDTEDFTIEPNPLTAHQTGVDYTHALCVERDEDWAMVVEKIQGGIFPNTIGHYLNWMLDTVGVPPELLLAPGEQIVVSVEPDPGDEFIDRINDLDRVTKASFRVVRPNPGWDDLETELGAEAGTSDAAYAEVQMSATRKSTLRKDRGIVSHIKALFRARRLGHAAIAGVRDGAEDKFTTEQLGKKEYRAVQLDERGQVIPSDAYNQMEEIIEGEDEKAKEEK